jgi:GNAT superfamily N-acetyltransferase
MHTFRPLSSSEIDLAHALYLRVFGWLREKGVRQWLVPLPRDAFSARQARAELFGYFTSQQLEAVVTLADEAPVDWQPEIGASPRFWMKSLAVDRCIGGHGVGSAVIQACETLATQHGYEALWLDCVDAGFLPIYYGRCGYERQTSKPITYPSGNTFPMVLMKKNLPNSS